MLAQDHARWLDLDYRPKLPQDKSRGIAIIGAGEIVKACHLPAYQMAGLHVIGIYDVDQQKAQLLADQFKLKHVFATIDQLLSHPEVVVVDIAVPAKFQPRIVEQVVRKGKHVLCQKPLAESYEEARSIVEMVKQAGVKGAVNQQMRWSPGIMASKQIVKRGWLGDVTQASIQVNVFTDWNQWPWITQIEQLEVMYHSIHYLDSLRYVVGAVPEAIFADGAKFPGQTSIGETRTLIHIKFPGETRGLIHDNHNHIANQEDWYATFRFEGTAGIIKGTNGSLYNYPVGREDTIHYFSQKIDPDYWFTPQLHGRWFPHAFIGTMGELLRAIEEDREPENSVQDNLYTMKMVFASYRAMKEQRLVSLDEFN